MSAPSITRSEVHNALLDLATAFNRPAKWAGDHLDLAEQRWARIQPLRLKKIVTQIIDSSVDSPRNIIAAVLSHHNSMPYVSHDDTPVCPKCLYGWITLRVVYADHDTGRVSAIGHDSAAAVRCDCTQGKQLCGAIPSVTAYIPDWLAQRLVCEAGRVYVLGETPHVTDHGAKDYGVQPVYVLLHGRVGDGRRSRIAAIQHDVPAAGSIIEGITRASAPTILDAPEEPEPAPEPLEQELPF